MSQEQPDITPVILAGGAGTRLRPLTSPARPKPFLRVFGGYSLLQHTAQRAAGFKPPVVVTSKIYGQKVLEDLCEIGLQPSRIVLEPASRSTAAAICQAALTLERDALMLVMPSDHYIEDAGVFQSAATEAAAAGGVAMLGAAPSKPSQRYGYIRCDDEGAVLSFVEKPPMGDARAFLKQGNVFWNTGIFAVRAGDLLDLFEGFAPQILTACRAAHEGAVKSGIFYEPDFIAFSSAPLEAIDTAIMEKISGARLVALETRWSDVGAWPDFLKVKLKRMYA